MRLIAFATAMIVGSWVSRAGAVDFVHDVVPILKKHCVQCHGGTEAKGGFSLNTRVSFLESEAATVGDPDASHFLALIRSDDADLQMPPKELPRVSPQDVKTLRSWIRADMPWLESFTFAVRDYRPPLLPRKVALPGDSKANPIDRLLARYLADNRLRAPDLIDDAAFVRRASLDLNGLLPDPKVVQEFVADGAPDKHAKLIDQMLADDVAYAEHWLTFWNDLLRNDYAGTGFITGGRKQISRWLYRSLIENKPFDQFTRELVAPQTDESRGFIDGIKWRGTVSAGQTVEIQFAQSVAQSFLGINLKCASCHDSFIDRWTLGEAYSLAAVYAKDPLPIHRCDKPTGKQATAAWLFPELGQIDASAPRQERLRQLADLMTDRRNGRYSRTIANRLWAAMMGRGIVHPLDAMHTRPWNEDLLDYLAEYLVENRYDLKAVLRLIATSNAYRSRSETSPERISSNEYVYAGRRAKRMTAEQFVDAVWTLTGAAPLKFDAPIVRGKDTQKSEDGDLELKGQWIWGESAAGGKASPGGEQIVFRKQIELPSEVESGVAVVTADNAFEMYIGRRKVAASQEWSQLQSVPLRGLLKKGKNDIVIVARNFLDTPNLAAMYFEADFVLADQSEWRISSDRTWQVSAKKPTGGREGRLGKVAGPWKDATDLGKPNAYAAIDAQAKTSLQRGRFKENSMVRAALLKSDFLMRSLGRPNRDQIVTSRPSDLTTLEAIDLANGETFAGALSIGAAHWAARYDSAETLVNDLFRSALSRAPTDNERKSILSVLDDDLDEETVADVMWAICMMPEFVMVR